MYHVFCAPYFAFGNILWASNYKTNLEKLFVLQKKIIRIIHSLPFTAHTTAYFLNSGLLNVYDMNKFHICLFMYKLKMDLLPAFFKDMFSTNDKIHTYNTRQASFFHVQFCKTNLSKFLLQYRGPQFFNAIPTRVKNAINLAVFKKELKVFLLSQYQP